MNMDDKITRNFRRVCEIAPEVRNIAPATTAADLMNFEKAISLAYLVGVLDGGAEVKQAIDVFFARREVEAQK
jgi:hypothetical protein